MKYLVLMSSTEATALTVVSGLYNYYEMLKTIPLPALFVDDLGPLVTQYLPLSSATPAKTLERETFLKI